MSQVESDPRSVAKAAAEARSLRKLELLAVDKEMGPFILIFFFLDKAHELHVGIIIFF